MTLKLVKYLYRSALECGVESGRRTRLRALRQITAPLMRTGVIATWCFIFVGVMRELSAAIILFTSETKAVTVLIFDHNESGDLGDIAANYDPGRNRRQPDSRVWLRRTAQQLSGQGSIDPMNPPILLQVSRRRLGPLWVNIRRR